MTDRPVGVFRRTFEAKKFPTGSGIRADLNRNALTSEYSPSKRYIARVEIPESETHVAYTLSESFERKSDAEAWYASHGGKL